MQYERGTNMLKVFANLLLTFLQQECHSNAPNRENQSWTNCDEVYVLTPVLLTKWFLRSIISISEHTALVVVGSCLLLWLGTWGLWLGPSLIRGSWFRLGLLLLLLLLPRLLKTSYVWKMIIIDDRNTRYNTTQQIKYMSSFCITGHTAFALIWYIFIFSSWGSKSFGISVLIFTRTSMNLLMFYLLYTTM